MISGLGRGPGTSHLPKNNRNHAVFNDFGDALGIPITPHRAKKLLKSVCLLPMYGFPDLPVPSYSQELHSPPAPQKRSCGTSKWASSGPPARLWPFKPCAEPCADLVPSMAVLLKKKMIMGILSGKAFENTRTSMDRHPPSPFPRPPARHRPRLASESHEMLGAVIIFMVSGMGGKRAAGIRII